MDSGISTVRNLLYIVLVVALLGTACSLYVGTELARNSNELSNLSKLVQDQLMTSATEQSKQLQEHMDQLHGDLAATDGKLAKAREDMVTELNKKAPGIIGNAMDQYIQKKRPQVEQQVLKQFPQQ